MTDKKLNKTTLSIIAIAVIVIVIAILVWLSQRKAGEAIINGGGGNGDGNGDGNGGGGNGAADLINAGTPNYMEIRTYGTGLEYRYAYIGNIYTYEGIFEDVLQRLRQNLHQGRISQLQYSNALAQLKNLGY